MDDIKPVNRQSVFQEAAGNSSRGPNPDFRSLNISKIPPDEVKPDFKLVKQVAVVFDIATGIVGLIPAVGWGLNAFLFFPSGFITLYFMANSRGGSLSEFISAYKFGVVEAVPYLNIVTPVFITGAYRLAGENLLDALTQKL